MDFHWYPGHMHKANKEMLEVLPQVDLIIEVLDARLPYSSENPAIEKLATDKPRLKVLSKSDLADSNKTTMWQEYYQQDPNIKVVITDQDKSETVKQIIQLCQQLVPNKVAMGKKITAMICGIPNVGKSTLINALAGRIIAKTGNEPAVTKGQQRINLEQGILLLDTPGILWPKIYNENSSYRLAATGAMKDTAISYDDVAFWLAEYLLQDYPQLLKDRYQLDELPETELEFMETIGAKRGCLRAGGRVDLEKISTLLMHEFRSGKVGHITLETPDIAEVEKVEAAEKEAARGEKKKNKKLRRR